MPFGSIEKALVNRNSVNIVFFLSLMLLMLSGNCWRRLLHSQPSTHFAAPFARPTLRYVHKPPNAVTARFAFSSAFTGVNPHIRTKNLTRKSNRALMVEYVNSNNVTGATDLYKSILQNITAKTNLEAALMFLQLCDYEARAQHIKEIGNTLKARNIVLPQQVFTFTVRSHCEMKDIESAWRTLEDMQRQGIQLRLRDLQPLLDLCASTADVHNALRVFEMISVHQLPIRVRQLLPLFEAFFSWRSRDSATDLAEKESVRSRVDMILQTSSSLCLTFGDDDLRTIARLANGITDAELDDLGVLVRDIIDVGNSTSQSSQFEVEGHVSSMVTRSSSSSDAYVDGRSSESHKQTMQWVEQKFVVQSKIDELVKAQSSNPSVLRFARPNTPEQLSSSARLVQISEFACRCPYCESSIKSTPLSEQEKRNVRNGLMKVALERSALHARYLEAFGDWLAERPPVDYVIDGANVAYQNQNHKFGRFSYKQIEIVVKKILSMGKRPLVVLSSGYCGTHPIVLNSVGDTSCIQKFTIAPEEKAFIDFLKDNDYLYAVPKGANDDWYWIFSTVHDPASQHSSYVLTNDLMRDHRLSVFVQQSFLRWRWSRVSYYSIVRAIPDMSTMEQGTTDVDSYGPSNDMHFDGDVTLQPPVELSRDIQFSSDTQRWHLPTDVSSTWLCLSTNPTMQN